MSARETKRLCSGLFRRLVGKNLRTLVVSAGFPYHKSPHLYQWLWVFILLPFLEEDTLNELRENYGKPLRALYRILIRHPQAFARLLHSLTFPLFFEVVEEFEHLDDSAKSRKRPKMIIDDTKSERFGKAMEFIHKLFDPGKDRYIWGYNYVLVLVKAGELVFPLSIMLWVPDTHPQHRSKNDMVREFLQTLQAETQKRGQSLEEVELLIDSAYHVVKVITAAKVLGIRIISKAANTHKFEFEGERLYPREIIEKVKHREWKSFHNGRSYQRVVSMHPTYGQVILLVRKRRLKNGNLVDDVLSCHATFYNALRIDKAYKERWEIELHFKYYKQYLAFGKHSFQKLGAITSQASCVALAGLVVALYRRQCSRKLSFRKAVKQMKAEMTEHNLPDYNNLQGNLLKCAA